MRVVKAHVFAKPFAIERQPSRQAEYFIAPYRRMPADLPSPASTPNASGDLAKPRARPTVRAYSAEPFPAVSSPNSRPLRNDLPDSAARMQAAVSPRRERDQANAVSGAGACDRRILESWRQSVWTKSRFARAVVQANPQFAELSVMMLRRKSSRVLKRRYARPRSSHLAPDHFIKAQHMNCLGALSYPRVSLDHAVIKAPAVHVVDAGDRIPRHLA